MIILRLEGRLELDLDLRQRVYQHVKAEVQRNYNSGRDFNVVIDLPHDGALARFPDFDVSRMIAVKVRRNPPAARENQPDARA
jgi:hypothetical protein